MRRLIVLAVVLLGLPAFGQAYVTRNQLENYELQGRIRLTDTDPNTNACSETDEPHALMYVPSGGATWTIYTCQSSQWTALINMTAAASEGTCSSSERYRTKVVTGGVGAADSFVICLKNASDTYNWVQVVTGGP